MIRAQKIAPRGQVAQRAWIEPSIDSTWLRRAFSCEIANHPECPWFRHDKYGKASRRCPRPPRRVFDRHFVQRCPVRCFAIYGLWDVSPRIPTLARRSCCYGRQTSLVSISRSPNLPLLCPCPAPNVNNSSAAPTPTAGPKHSSNSIRVKQLTEPHYRRQAP